MADKLDWLNKHLVLIRHLQVAEAEKENYHVPDDLAGLFAGVNGTEEMVFRLAGGGHFKAACELSAYIAHRRAGVWWGYRCLLSLLEELRQNPAVDRDIADIGGDFEVKVPDWAKVELPEPVDTSQIKALIDETQDDTTRRMRQMVDPKVMKLVEESVEEAFQVFKKTHGIHPLDLIKKLGARVNEPTHQVDPASPVFKAEAELKAKLQAVRKETVETIKAVIPPKVPAVEKKKRDNALAAVYRWVAAPDAENSQKCLDTGNECPDTPAGLLCLSAFWAYGDLMPLGEHTVPTPPGLAANGLTQTLLLCALHKGGTRKVKERFEEYFRLGVEVLSGADNWESSLADKIMPHEKIGPAPEPAAPAGPAEKPEPVNNAPPSAAPAGAAQTPPQNGLNGNGYKRWKPDGEN